MSMNVRFFLKDGSPIDELAKRFNFTIYSELGNTFFDKTDCKWLPNDLMSHVNHISVMGHFIANPKRTIGLYYFSSEKEGYRATLDYDSQNPNRYYLRVGYVSSLQTFWDFHDALRKGVLQPYESWENPLSGTKSAE